MKKITLTLILIVLFTSLFGQSIDNRLLGLDEEVLKWMEEYKAVGLSIAIVNNDDIIYNKSFGYRDLDNEMPITENTVFPIASCTKAFTATLLGILDEENKLSLLDKPSFHIPNLEFNTAEMNASISISDLLSHRSGLGAINGTLVLFPENNRLKVMEKLKYIVPEGKVKESSIYSNMGYTIAGTVVEEVTKNSWEKNISDKIFLPLKMNHSYTSLEKAQKSNNFSLGYGMFQNEIKQVNFENYYDYNPAGGIRSTSNDLAHWMIAWLNDGYFEGTQVIPNNFIKNAIKFHNFRDADDEANLFFQGYGLGWRVETKDGEYRVQHGGNTSGFSNLIVFYPFKGFGITILTNQDDSILPYIIADIVQNRMFNKGSVNDYPVVVQDIYQSKPLKTEINNEKPASKEFSKFVGEYEHKGYGKVDIILEENELFAVFTTYKFFLEHLHYDIFVMKPLGNISDVFNPEFGLNFRMDENGEITSFTMNLQSDPVEFIKSN